MLVSVSYRETKKIKKPCPYITRKIFLFNFSAFPKNNLKSSNSLFLVIKLKKKMGLLGSCNSIIISERKDYSNYIVFGIGRDIYHPYFCTAV